MLTHQRLFKFIKCNVAGLAIATMTTPALASTVLPQDLPEPGTVGMVAMAVVGVIVTARLTRRK